MSDVNVCKCIEHPKIFNNSVFKHVDKSLNIKILCFSSVYEIEKLNNKIHQNKMMRSKNLDIM